MKENSPQNRGEILKSMIGENPTKEALFRANQHLDDAEAMKKAGWKPERRPTREEIKRFVITPEKWQEAMNFYHQRKNELIGAAALNRDNAFSYRGFKVGCAVAGMGPKAKDEEYIVWQAGNFKLQPGHVEGKEKRCAERNALDSAQTELKTVFAIATVSKESSTSDPTKAHDVLHPCKDCRQMFRELLKKGFLKDDTIILSANDAQEKIITEETTLKKLLELYNDDNLK
ncbi:MAG: cytidine deaminase [Candidatus Paceibacterota bacterium]